jgi:hypothetical protein
MPGSKQGAVLIGRSGMHTARRADGGDNGVDDPGAV